MHSITSSLVFVFISLIVTTLLAIALSDKNMVEFCSKNYFDRILTEKIVSIGKSLYCIVNNDLDVNELDVNRHVVCEYN